MEKDFFILLIDVNADPKVVWKGYINDTNKSIGIDVSKNNGYINWEAVKSDGISGALLKQQKAILKLLWENEVVRIGIDFIEQYDQCIHERYLCCP